MALFEPSWQKREDLFIVPRGGWILAAILLTAVCLAGGRPLWVQGIVTLGIGLLWLVWPPLKSPRMSVIWTLAALAIAPLAAYMPKALFSVPGWRQELERLAAIAASAFITPQPWFTFHIWLLWLAGVALVAWCVLQSWDHYNRDTLARMFTVSLAGITVYALFASLTGRQPDMWQSQHGFGPFLNRNQWGSVMGMGGVMAIALAHQAVRRASKRAFIFWLLCLGIFAGSIVYNGSRGGIVVLAAGGFAYWTIFGLIQKHYRYAAIAVSFLLISFAIFSVGGGELLERFIGPSEKGFGADARIEFYRMTRNMIADSPVAGFGLGNFEYVFPFYFDHEPTRLYHALHPESSFLWLASEAGLLTVAAVAAAFVLLFALGWGARRSRASTIRSAGLACAFVMVANAFFDVSGHRIGSLVPGILFASLAMPPADRKSIGTGLSLVLRAAGLALVLLGLVWIATAFGRPILAAAQGTLGLRAAAGEAREAGDRARAIELLRASAQLKPIDWDTHWALATYLVEDGQPDAAWNEFRAVAGLMPFVPWITEKEGYFWLPDHPARAAYAWTETLKRKSPGERAAMYAGFLRTAKSEPALNAILQRFSPDDPDFEFTRIRASGAAGTKRIPRMLAKTDNLSTAPDHLVEPVMAYMLQNSMTDQLDTLTAQSERLRRLGWRVLADRAVREKRLGDALGMHFQYGPRPALPAPISRSDLRSVERAAALAPMDIATAVAYYQALEMARRKDDAFWQLRRIMEIPNAPPYVWYLAARAAYDKGDHEEAWNFFRTYQEKSKQ